MKYIRLFAITTAMLFVGLCVAQAGTLREDVAYWYTDGNSIKTLFNPAAQDLNPLVQAGRVLVKVQQTVYDQASSASILARNGNGSHPGYLYAYSVTNINCGDASDMADMGVTSFHVDWSTNYFAAVSRQTPLGWVVDTTTTTGPTWKWTGTDAGILPGDTVGGFWAVSNVGVDGECKGTAVYVGPNRPQGPFSGLTTGPYVPEPASMVSLLLGLAGIGFTAIRRRK